MALGAAVIRCATQDLGRTTFLCRGSLTLVTGVISELVPFVWYIFNNRDKLIDRGMIFSKNPGTDGRGWRRALIFVAICSLTFCVATRFSVSVSAPGHVVKSMDLRSSGTKQQRLDQDDSRFAEPVSTGTAVRRVVLSFSVIPPEPLRSNDVFCLDLYNRPPPLSSGFFL